jgi:hypothetical protein
MQLQSIPKSLVALLVTGKRREMAAQIVNANAGYA